MSTPVRLGPRASLLLGLLASPKTIRELNAEIARILDDDLIEDVAGTGALSGVFGSARLALEHLRDGGSAEVRRHLHRLEEFGFAERILAPSDSWVADADGDLWWGSM